jgi:hypothetical protein
VKLFQDVAPGIGLLEREDVSRMLSETMAGRILDGFRGPRLDKETVIDLAIRVSRLMDEHPEIHEIALKIWRHYGRPFCGERYAKHCEKGGAR